MSKNFKFTSLLLSLMLCFSAVAFGQETTGELQGTVKDPAGAVIPNATINFKGVDVGFNRTENTDEQGFYRARRLPPGVYTVTASATGFGNKVADNVQIVLGNTNTLNFDLAVGSNQVSVDVSAGDSGVIVDATETKAQDNLSARDIEALPKGTTFSTLLNRTSQLRSDPSSGQFTVNGATGPENSFILDGQEVQNFRTGVLNTANDIPFQSVQEIQVRTSGFEAEFGGATGGVINVVTKSGTNQLRGDFGLQFAPSKLNAGSRPILNTTTGLPTDSEQFAEYLPQGRDRGTNFFPTAALGGPIVKDKLWFFGIYSPQYFNSTRDLSFYRAYNGTTVPVGARISQPNGQLSATLKRKQEYGFIRLDASPINSLRLSSSFTYNPIIDRGGLPAGNTFFATVPSIPLGGQTLSGSDYYGAQGGRQNANNFRFEGTYTPNGKLVLTGRYTRGFLNEKLGSYGIPNIPRVQCAFSAYTNAQGQQVSVAQLSALAGCQPGFTTTPNNNVINYDVSVRNTIDANASYLLGSFLGRHEFKGGYQFSKISNDVSTGAVNTGRIVLCYGRFSGLNQCLGFPSPGVTFTPQNAPLGIGQLYRFGTQGAASNTAHTVFVQDKWQPFSRLTLNLGLRTEQEKLPAFNGIQTGLKFSFKDKLAPRLGAAYALTSDGKTKISAFYGWFYDRLKFELPRGSFGGDFYHVDTFAIDPAHPEYSYYNIANITASTGSPAGGNCPLPNAPFGQSRCQIDLRVPSNIPGLIAQVLGGDAPADAGSVDPNLKPFRQSEFTFEFQREVMRASVFTARYLHRNVDHAVEDAGFLTPGESEFYDIANPGEGLNLKHSQEFGFAKAAKPERVYNALQLELATRFVRNFDLNVNYTLSRLKGNYSGLANPDEASATTGIGRNSPGVNRFFDQPYVGFTAAGTPDNGILPLDRTHVFKASGTYSFGWFKSKVNTTDASFFTTYQTGTPITTFVNVLQGIPIPLTKRGDLGRTEAFTQTDLNLSHRYKFGRDDRLTMEFDFNVLNVFNEANVISVNNELDGPEFNIPFSDLDQPGRPTYAQAVNILTSTGVLNLVNANGTPQSNPGAFNAAYKLPTFFQNPRTVRFGFRLLF